LFSNPFSFSIDSQSGAGGLPPSSSGTQKAASTSYGAYGIAKNNKMSDVSTTESKIDLALPDWSPSLNYQTNSL
jgi:hypothetical protein